jgi:hypothetical protein
MGGLLAADTILELVRPHREGKAASIWPTVVACVAFDTPVSCCYNYPSPRLAPNAISTVPWATAVCF